MVVSDHISQELQDGIKAGQGQWHKNPHSLLDLLQKHAFEMNLDSLRLIANIAQISPIQIWAAYEDWLKRQDQEVLKICDNLTCLAKGAVETRKFFKKNCPKGLEIQWIQCLGGCASGPCVQYRGKLLTQMSLKKVQELIQEETQIP
jgi:NADH:ubiquinone oxidoreductase subunit E